MYDKLSLKNVLNYHQYYPYTYRYTSEIQPEKSQTISFNNVQMSQIPTKIIICARKNLSEQNCNDSNSFLAIDAINMNFNNKSGLLSSAQPQQLYEMSRKNGYHSNYYEFSGRGATGNVQSGASNVNTIATSGSIIVIDPALDLSLGPAYTDSSTGQYNCQFQVTVRNQTNEKIAPEIVMIAIYSGLFTTDNGTSSYQTGFITQEAVLNTRSKKSLLLDTETYQKIVGGAIENINSIHKHINRYFKNHSSHEKDLEKPERRRRRR
jgi:hypothetical protein